MTYDVLAALVVAFLLFLTFSWAVAALNVFEKLANRWLVLQENEVAHRIERAANLSDALREKLGYVAKPKATPPSTDLDKPFEGFE